MPAKIVNHLQRFIDAREFAATKAMTAGLIAIGSEASVLTPIDTSALLNSQYREVKREGSRIIGKIGYGASYARYVHDPAVIQRFRRASAEKEFLTKGAERAQPIFDRIVNGYMKV